MVKLDVKLWNGTYTETFQVIATTQSEARQRAREVAQRDYGDFVITSMSYVH